jgi:glycosyltransferase involved in cell wall biosynthesis
MNQTHKPSISIVVITLNEEKNIGRCLKSLKFSKNIFSKPEILVVDALSKDKTGSLARKLGAKVFLRPWKGYADQKNWAFGKTKGKWILSLDADEELTPELCREIERKVTHNEAVDGYFIKRRAFFLGKWIKHCGWWPDAQLRLIKKGKGKFSNRPVHEGLEVKGKTGVLREPMNHYTYDSIGQYLEKMERYSDLFLLSASQKKKNLWLAYLLFMPPWIFFKMYGLKLGFLDGWRGFQVCALSAYHEYVKYRKLGFPSHG